MEETLETLKRKIRIHKEGSDKKLIHYPQNLKKEVLEFLTKNSIKNSSFCKEVGLNISTLNKWQKPSKSIKSSSKKDSFFKPLSVKIERSSSEIQICVLKGLNFKEVCEILKKL